MKKIAGGFAAIRIKEDNQARCRKVTNNPYPKSGGISQLTGPSNIAPKQRMSTNATTTHDLRLRLNDLETIVPNVRTMIDQ